jgi:hypothetical protein
LGNGYIFGGEDYRVESDLWKFNIQTESWEKIIESNSPPPMSNAVTWKDSLGNVYVFGGADKISYYNDLWKFNINTNSWNKIHKNNSFPAVRAYAVSWVDNAGNAYVFGGYNKSGVFNDLWKYNMQTESWTNIKESNAPSPRYSSVAWIDNAGNAYVFGGGNCIGNDLWQYNMQTKTWLQMQQVNPPSPRFNAMTWIDKSNNVYIFGGEASLILNDLWMYNYKNMGVKINN